MKVVNKDFMQLDSSIANAMGSDIYAMHKRANAGDGHDARGLIVAVMLCAACWTALAYFLLAR